MWTCPRRVYVLSSRRWELLPNNQKVSFLCQTGCYLGASIHVGDFWPNGWVRFQPKFSTLAKVVVHKLDTALQTKSMSRDDTNKLRGDLQCAGFLGRIANPILSCHQSGNRVDLTSEDECILRLLRIIASHAKPRYVCVGASEKPRTTLYSDASFEDGRLRLGGIIFPPIGQPLGGSTLVPPEVLASWAPRHQQIFPKEALCLLEDADLLWFCDKTRPLWPPSFARLQTRRTFALFVKGRMSFWRH